ncbi:hypothetical protein [Streptomyces sp. NPDC001536]|uniref:hypothetical protein n=1 Tax=Streptomyces sp. NPDC001536 TaxID=3364583 RepID=UPI00369E354B
MASRRSGKSGADLYVQLYGRPSAAAPAAPPPTIAAGSPMPAETSSYWKDGDRDPTKQRDIPRLFPYFYHSVLARNGKAVHGRNIMPLIEYIDAMLIFQGNLWFQKIEDPRTGEVFRQRFLIALDEYELPEHRPDDVIDFLWSWRTTARPGLRQFVDQKYTDLTSPSSKLLEFGDTLPFGIWHRD